MATTLPQTDRRTGRRPERLPKTPPVPETPPAPPAASGPAAAFHKYRWIILVGLITSAILEVMDTTIVNVALPRMSGNFGATPDEIAWVSTGYILSNVVVLPMTAWLSQRIGRKRYLTGSIALFVLASVLCGFSHSLVEIVLFRVLQGGAGAALISTAQATLVEIFPAHQQSMVQGFFGLGLGVGPAIGPLIGGWLTDNFSWSWCFFINLPIGIMALVLVGAFLSDTTTAADNAAARSNPIDSIGIGLLAIGLGAHQYVLEEGKRLDWFDSPLIKALTAVAAIGLALFLFWELRPQNRHPVLDLRVYKDRGLAASVALAFAQGFALYGMLFLFPQFAQNILGFSPTETGLVLLPQGLVIAVSIGVSSTAMEKGTDPRPVIFTGLAVGAVGLWLLGHLTAASGIPDCRLALMTAGFGIGCLFIPLTLTAFAGLQGPQIATGSSLLNLGRQIGGSVGIAVLNTWVTNAAATARAGIVAHLTSAQSALPEREAGLTQAFMGQGYGLAAAQSAALHAIDGVVQTQSLVIAYESAFLVSGTVFVLVLPLVFFLQKGDASKAAGAGH